MEKQLRKVLGEKYKVEKIDDDILIYLSIVDYPEDCVKIEKIDDMFCIKRVNVRDEQLILICKDPIETMWYSYVIVKRLFDALSYDNRINRLKYILKVTGIDAALDRLNAYFPADVISVRSEDEKKISILVNGDSCDVKFAGRFIAQGACFERGLSICLNYCNKLLNIRGMFNNQIFPSADTVRLNICEEVYLFGNLYIEEDDD